ncbi:phosphohydrolase [Pseudomonas oryzihabitans]|uniref:phosphohydrolase n=1 Tax=Pseudomonas oryzihabitans TaxID=47885 RepID=UPI003D00BF4D
MTQTPDLGGWIVTSTGVRFELLAPTVEMIHLEDIAHALSNVCRFGGHTRVHYSVAQHSVLASHLVPPADALYALLHDATEAYIGDMVSPLKQVIPQFRQVEDRLWSVICEYFELPQQMPASVKRADLMMLAREREDLLPAGEPWALLEGVELPSEPIQPWEQRRAEIEFTHRFWQIVEGAQP